MAGAIHFYFDFASPFAYFANKQVRQMAAEFGCALEPRPIIMWAVLKAQRINMPTESAAKWNYLVADMRRSAAFYGIPYAHPAKLPLSAHLATRLYHCVRKDDAGLADTLAERLFQAFFVEHQDISDADVLRAIAADIGISGVDADEGMRGPEGRAFLSSAVDDAVAAGVVGSPYFIVDDEGFFGADRLPHLRWRLEGRSL